MKKHLGFFFFALAFSTWQTAFANTSCPSGVIKPFVGKYKGKSLLVRVNGDQQKLANEDTFAVIDCRSFGITVHYLDDSGKVVRTVELKASADNTVHAEIFSVNGTMTEGSAATKLTGTFRHIQEGTLLGTLQGVIAGQPAYMTELINVSAGGNEVERTIQMFADKRGGAYIGSRVVNDVKAK